MITRAEEGFPSIFFGRAREKAHKNQADERCPEPGKIIGMSLAHLPSVSSRVDADSASGAKAARILQATDTKVPARIEASPPAVVARFQKKAARTTGVIPAP